MIAKMAKIQIVGPKDFLLDTIQTICRYGKVQLGNARFGDYPAGVKVQVKEPTEEELTERMALEDIYHQLDRFLTLLADFPGIWAKKKGKAEKAPPPVVTLTMAKELSEKISSVESRLGDLNRKKIELRDELKLLQRFEGILQTFLPMMARFEKLPQLEVIGFTVKKRQTVVVDLLREQLQEATHGEFEVFLRELDAVTLAGVLSFPKQFKAMVQTLFLGSGISEIKLPAQFGDRPVPEALVALGERLMIIPGQLEEIDATTQKELADFDPRYLQSFRNAIGRRLATIKALPEVGATAKVFILMGWIPQGELEKFLADMKTKLPSEVHIFRIPISHADVDEDRVPVQLENPPLLKPFELCLKLISLPSYGSIDPTPFMAIFFPTFFGLILGDMAYGLILLAIALFLLKKFRGKPIIHDVGIILLICSLSTTLFGFLFGEFLGDLGHRLGFLTPILMNREHALFPTLFLAIGVGVAHVLLGVFLKLVSSVRHHHRKHAGEALGTLLVLVAVLTIIICMAGALPKDFFTPGIILLVIGVPILLFSGGVVAILEIFSVLGNMLSYARIMAIGLSSVVLAVVANRIAGSFSSVLVGVLLASILHLINLILGVFGPTIHSLRLHYVEFFGKFYQTGKTTYRPFKVEEEIPKEAQL